MLGQPSNLLQNVKNFLVGCALLVIIACGGASLDENLTSTWTSVGESTVLISPGATQATTIRLRNDSSGTSHSITGATHASVPTGWTVTFPSTIDLPRNNPNEVLFPVNINVPTGTTSGIRVFTVKLTSSIDGSFKLVDIAVTVGASAVTAIQETSTFTGRADGVFESALKLTNGDGIPITTLVDFRPVGFTAEVDALVWFSPKAGGFSIDPGDESTRTCRALPRTNATGRTFSMENYFYHKAVEYKYATAFTVKPPSAVAYTITGLDWRMGVNVADPDKVTNYTVTFDQVVTGKAGQYTFTVDNLNSTQYTAMITPSTVPVNSNGDPVSVQVQITRIGSGTEETVDEFTLIATHSNDATVDARLLLPIRTYVGS